VVDSSSEKIGKKIGGTDFIVQSPEILQSTVCGKIIINSLEYFDEIIQQVQRKYGEHKYFFRTLPHAEKIESLRV
jgi:hypothetical protein